jgi:outer membrane protein
MKYRHLRHASVRHLGAAFGAFAALMAWSNPSAAEPDQRWSARLGYAQASFDTQSTITVAGAPAAGASVTIDDQEVLLGDVGYAFNDHWTARLAVGAPIDLPVNAGGSLRAPGSPLAGTLGEVQVAPVVASVLYTPREFGRLEPYVGAGVAYAWMRDAQGVDVQSLQATSEWGVVVQAGCEAALSRRWSAFIDARKLYVDTSVSGAVAQLGSVPVAASVGLDPLILNAGIGYRF